MSESKGTLYMSLISLVVSTSCDIAEVMKLLSSALLHRPVVFIELWELERREEAREHLELGRFSVL